MAKCVFLSIVLLCETSIECIIIGWCSNPGGHTVLSVWTFQCGSNLESAEQVGEWPQHFYVDKSSST